MDKPIKLVDLSKLTPEQRDALAQLYKDAQAVAPRMEELKKTAVAVFREFMRAPLWHITKAPPPEDGIREEGWHVGAPVINDYRNKKRGDSA